MIPTYKQVMQELSRSDYAEYVEYVHNDRYIHGRFTRFVCGTVQEFIEADTGHAYDILILQSPPQHSKSMTLTETLPSWYLGKYSTKRVIEISYNDDFAKKFIRKNKEKIVEYGKEIFDIEIGEPNTANEFVLKNGIGSMQSRGMLSGITGNPADLIIIDDPIKNAEEAMSVNQREKMYEEWLSSIKSRLSVGAKVIVIMTRWHLDDIAGRLLRDEHNVTWINFPVECTVERDQIGRTYGDPLFPEFGKDKVWLEDFKKSHMTKQGRRSWEALFMGNPTNEEGNIFKRDDFQYYTVAPQMGYVAISVDATFKEGENSDYVAIHVWGKRGPDFYLLYRFKRIMGFVDTIKQMNQVIQKFSAYNVILVEDKANGSAIVDVLRRKYSAVVPINPDGGKIARANAVAPIFESKNVFVRESDQEFISEMCDFPNAAHDDEVDACTQALNRMRDYVAEVATPNDDEDVLDDDDQINNVMNYGY